MKHYILAVLSMFAVLATSAMASAPVEKEWTILVFLNGHNNLDEFGGKDINEMEKIGSTDKTNVVVQWASMSANTKRVFVKKDSDEENVTSPVVADIGVADMGDWNALVDFVNWGVKKYPAKHYFIDIWNHGNGWHIENGITIKDISYDDRSGHHITTEELAKAMAASAKAIGHKVDLYGSDACLMAMTEVANQMADSVSYFTGSEEVEPGLGWPYDMLLSDMQNASDLSPAAVSTMNTKDYVKSYEGGSQGDEQVVFSAFDLSQTGRLNAAISAFGTAIQKLNAKDRDAVKGALGKTQAFYLSDYKDFGDFVANVKGLGLTKIPPKTITDVEDAFKSYVIANAATSNYTPAQGMSIWLPDSQSDYDDYSGRYNKLVFNQSTNWSSTIASLLK